MTDWFARATARGVLPVIAIADAAHAVALADALAEGGLPVAEITFRTPAAAAAIGAIRNARPGFLVGAGTILDRASLLAARDAGARFALSPGFDPDAAEAAAEAAFPFAPGVMTASEIGLAARRGLRLMKFFPAGTAGGPAALESLSAPFAHLGLRFIPTGGIGESTIGDWLALPEVAAVGGTWIARPADISGGRWAEITARARAAVEAARRAGRAPP